MIPWTWYVKLSISWMHGALQCQGEQEGMCGLILVGIQSGQYKIIHLQTPALQHRARQSQMTLDTWSPAMRIDLMLIVLTTDNKTQKDTLGGGRCVCGMDRMRGTRVPCVWTHQIVHITYMQLFRCNYPPVNLLKMEDKEQQMDTGPSAPRESQPLAVSRKPPPSSPFTNWVLSLYFPVCSGWHHGLVFRKHHSQGLCTTHSSS